MLQIRLSKPASETGARAKPVSVDSVTVACPDHLILADLPVAKSLGSPSAAAVIKTVGRRSRRQLGERVHFCVQCDFPIAIYGRLSPCEHAFCLDCARSDSLCYLCDERIQKIQTIKMMEGIFICAAPHCFKSFLKKTEFESHIHETHADLLNPTREIEGDESDALSSRRPSATETSVQTPLPKPLFSPHSNSQVYDREDKTSRLQNPPPLRPAMQQPRAVPPFPGQVPNHPSEQHPPDGNQSLVFDRAAAQNCFPQQNFDSQGQVGPRQDSANPNSAMAPPQFGYPTYAPDGTQQFFGPPYEVARLDSTPESGQRQGSLLGYQPAPTGPMNFPPNYPQPWNMAPGIVPLEPPLVVVSQGTADGFMNVDHQAPQGRGFFQGDYGQNAGVMMPSKVPQLVANNKGVDPRDGKGISAPQPLSLPPPPPMPLPHLTQMQQRGSSDRSYSSDGNHDTPPGFGWPLERRDGFGGGQD